MPDLNPIVIKYFEGRSNSIWSSNEQYALTFSCLGSGLSYGEMSLRGREGDVKVAYQI